MKMVGGGHKLRYRGVGRNQMWAELTVAGYNLAHPTGLEPASQGVSGMNPALPDSRCMGYVG